MFSIVPFFTSIQPVVLPSKLVRASEFSTALKAKKAEGSAINRRDRRKKEKPFNDMGGLPVKNVTYF
jgi:hypothetical protein